MLLTGHFCSSALDSLSPPVLDLNSGLVLLPEHPLNLIMPSFLIYLFGRYIKSFVAIP